MRSRPRTLAAPALGVFAVVLALGTAETNAEPTRPIQLSSPAFTNGGDIPSTFTCEGKDISPPLAWSDVPAGAQSVALIVDDPDAPDPKAPTRTFVHWVLYNVPPGARALPENARAATLAEGGREGLNDWGGTGYRGPCPPVGKHRYFFKLYALDTKLEKLDAPAKGDLERAMAGHIVAKAELVGRYERQRK